MRLVVFTADPNLEDGIWWSIVLNAPQTSSVLLCRQIPSRDARSVVKRFRRNIRKHGLIYVPYRFGVALRDLVGRVVRGRKRPTRPPVPPHMPCETFESLDIHSEATLTRVRAWAPDLGMSIGAPILRRDLFEIPKRGTLNLHLGRVPDFRGAPPAFWELERGASKLGATVHWIDEGLDTGNVVTSGTAPLYPQDTLARAQRRLVELGRIVLLDALGTVAQSTVPGTPQPQEGRTYRYPTLRQRMRLSRRLRLQHARLTLSRPTYVPKRIAALVAMTAVRPLRNLWRSLRGSHPVRVFTFHRVSDLCRDPLTVSPDVFRRQIEYLQRSHTIVSLERALELLRDGASLHRPAAVITFDDGYRSVHEFAGPILADLRATACCFVCTDLVGTQKRYDHDRDNLVKPYLSVMTWEELQELLDLGWSVGGHTATHARLSECGEPVLQYELRTPIERIFERFGTRPLAMAFPFGQATDTSREAEELAAALGYAAYLSNWGGENRNSSDRFRLSRIDIGGDLPPFVWKARIQGFEFSKWRRLGRRRQGDGPS